MPVQREPELPVEGTSAKTSNFPHIGSSSDGPAENPVESSVSAAAELTRLSPETSAFSKLSDNNDFPISSYPGSDSWACPGNSEDVFSHFLYWRTPLPDISKDLELLLSEAGPQEDYCSRPGVVYNNCVARSEIQKVLDSLQEHLMNDPDVQGKCCSLSLKRRWDVSVSCVAFRHFLLPQACVLTHVCVDLYLFTLCTHWEERLVQSQYSLKSQKYLCAGAYAMILLSNFADGRAQSLKSVLIGKWVVCGHICSRGNFVSSLDTLLHHLPHRMPFLVMNSQGWPPFGAY